MKFNRLVLFVLLALMAGVLSACGGAVSTAWPGVTVEGDIAYLADGLFVYQVDLNTGAEITRTVNGETKPVRFPETSNNQVNFFAPPVLTPDGQLIVGSAGHSHNLYSINPETFTVNWVFEDARDVYLGSVLVLNDRIYAPNGDSNLYVLDLKGNLLATFDMPEHGLWSAPMTDGQTIYLTALDHYVYALDPSTLSVKWKTKLDGAINASAALSADGWLYVGTLNKTLFALDASNGSIVWQRPLAGWLYSSPSLDGDTLYIGAVVGATDGKVYAIDAVNGAQRWEYPTGSAVAGKILVLDGSVAFTTENGTLGVLKKDGALDWKETYEHNFYAGPLMWNDTLLAAPSQSQTLLVAINPANRSIKWKFPQEK